MNGSGPVQCCDRPGSGHDFLLLNAIAMASAPKQAGQAVGRQIVLPMKKAVEIAYKNIRLRLARSLLVTSGIVLALAFLMSILASDAILSAMRVWAGDTSSTESLTKQSEALKIQVNAKATELGQALAALPENAPAGTFDYTKYVGVEKKRDDLPAILGVSQLPLPGDSLTKLLANDPKSVALFEQWVEVAGKLGAVRAQLTAPQQLMSIMEANGEPSTPTAIAGSKVQTRWLLGLALLVAFVGILNAMLMSVTERFREIGTMKCLGALDGFIVKLFLIESFFQGMVGTVLGVGLGLLLSIVGASLAYGHFAWIQFPWQPIITSAGFCFLVGVGLTVAGAVYPAWQAARMQPIEAMRAQT